MKGKTHFLFSIAFIVFVIFGCSLEVPEGGVAIGDSVLNFLPADEVNDQARAPTGEEFDFRTMLPVSFKLKVDAYDLRGVTAASARSLAPIPFGSKVEAINIIIVLTNTEKKTLYLGHITSEETLEFESILPIVSKDLLLTIIADGFVPRTIVISDAVQFELIDRELSIGMTEKSILEKKLGDTDKDYIPDKYDAFPLNSAKAFVVQTPLDGPMTITYEDLYPVPGDADYNDFYANYSIEEIYNGNGGRSEIHGKVKIRARGAGYDHRFGIRIFLGETLEKEPVTGTLDVEYYDHEGNWIDGITGETVTGVANIVIFERTKQSFWRPIPYVTMDNAWPDKLDSKGYMTEFSIYLDTEIKPIFKKNDPRAKYAMPPYDPYLYVHSVTPKRDIHLINLPKMDDSTNKDSDPQDFRYDHGKMEGFPWCMLLPVDWPYPIERTHIHDVYPEFQGWYQSNGTENTDWYLHPNPDLVITPEATEKPLPPVTINGIYIDTHDPEWALLWVRADTKFELYKADGEFVAASMGGSGVFDKLDYNEDLVFDDANPHYYIKLITESGLSGETPYTIRFYGSDDTPTAPQIDNTYVMGPDVSEGLDPPGTSAPWANPQYVPASVSIGDSVTRTLTSAVDVDWFKLVRSQ